MTTLNISVAESTKAFLEQQAHDEGYGDVNEYVHAILSALQKRKARSELEAKLREGQQSPVIRMTERHWRELEAELKRRSPELASE